MLKNTNYLSPHVESKTPLHRSAEWSEFAICLCIPLQYLKANTLGFDDVPERGDWPKYGAHEPYSSK